MGRERKDVVYARARAHRHTSHAPLPQTTAIEQRSNAHRTSAPLRCLTLPNEQREVPLDYETVAPMGIHSGHRVALVLLHDYRSTGDPEYRGVPVSLYFRSQSARKPNSFYDYVPLTVCVLVPCVCVSAPPLVFDLS